MSKKHTQKDIFEAVAANDSKFAALARSAKYFYIPVALGVGAIVNLGSYLYSAKQAENALLPEGGMKELFEKCQRQASSPKFSEQHFREETECVDKVWLPAKEKRNDVLIEGIVISGALAGAFLVATAAAYLKTHKLSIEAERGVGRYLNGLDFRRKRKSDILVIKNDKTHGDLKP